MSDESEPRAIRRADARQAEDDGAKQTWVDLVDHGGGDGGGLQTHDGSCMSMPDIAKAISDGVAMHARSIPKTPGATSMAWSRINA